MWREEKKKTEKLFSFSKIKHQYAWSLTLIYTLKIGIMPQTCGAPPKYTGGGEGRE